VRIVVAMSGGVDSSAVAGLLHRQGHEVIGVTLQLYDHGAATSRKGACCAGQDIHDARRVADSLGIPHYTIDAETRFAESVIQGFADSYANGETPVPCITCNQTVKFADLTKLARGLNADRLATGHYVRRHDGPAGAELHRAADPARDQSWFLYATTPDQLALSLFPLGDMPDKSSVRALARDLGLQVADKPDSQDICFVPQGTYTDIVAKLRPDALAPGDIVTTTGTVVGRHDGIARYTVGQTKRLGDAATLAGERQAVLSTDATTRRITIGPRTTGTTTLRLRDVNWLLAGPPQDRRVQVRLRARDSLRDAVVTTRDGTTEVALREPALPAPGQACVFYDGTRILGGGVIRRP
jgi:tRNA-specific 2-thiouridylase